MPRTATLADVKAKVAEITVPKNKAERCLGLHSNEMLVPHRSPPRSRPLDPQPTPNRVRSQPPLVEGGAFTQWMRAFGEPDVRLQTMVERWLLLPQSEREALVQAAKGPMRGAREQPEGQNTRRPPDRRGGVRGRKRAFDGVPAPALLASIQRKYRCKDGAMCRCVTKGRVP